MRLFHTRQLLIQPLVLEGETFVIHPQQVQHRRVEIVDVHTHHRQVLTLCYPGDAEPAAGLISVLSPVGSSLLGLRAGDTARWLTPPGEGCAAQIAAIQYQPEAAGDYTR